MKYSFLSRILPWLIMAGIAGFAFYTLNVKLAEVIAPKVIQNNTANQIMGAGTLEARVKTQVSARIQERLVEVLADQGDTVKKGQLLAKLDDAELRQQAAIAQASFAAAKQTAQRVEADLARSQAVLEQARKDAKRLAGLLASNAVSQTDSDKAAEALKVAEADLKRSNAAIAEAQGLVLVAEKTMRHR